MKKWLMLLPVISMLAGCGYTDEERKEFYVGCLQSVGYDQYKYDGILVQCACKNWSMRSDINPRNGTQQVKEELENCQTKSTKMTYQERAQFQDVCSAELLRYVRVSSRAKMAAIYMGTMRIANEEVDDAIRVLKCACTRFSLRDDFVYPRNTDDLYTKISSDITECRE